MWPLDLPACQVLKLPGQATIPWAIFDWKWYLHTYPHVANIVPETDPPAVLNYYLELGQEQGHSPNRLFDEQWHRATYPQIAERLAEGHYTSVFDAYCRRGALDRSAHWLFDEVAYRDRYPDLTDEILAANGIVNRYDHYLRHGGEEDRIGHVMFDPAVYLANFDPVDVAAIRQKGAFQHYLSRIESDEPELRTSIYFDPAWYVTRYPDVGRLIEAKRWKCALHHYLCNDTPTAFDPSENFSEAWYLQRDPGLPQVIGPGGFRNGYAHFLRFGVTELRSPAASIDLTWYAAQPAVRSDLRLDGPPDAYTHWLMIGARTGLPSAKPDSESVSEPQARCLLRQTSAALLPIAGRFGYAFDVEGTPAVSVILVVRNDFVATMATIASLHSIMPLGLELIIIDRESDDETQSIEQYVSAARVLRLESDIAWSHVADAGRRLAAAPVLLFLSSDARIAPGSIERAWGRLAVDPSVGAVGAMILQPHGIVAQAGGILWNDGTVSDYGHGTSPLSPEVNFVRDVDFCAPALLLVRAELLSRLGGFDHDCAPGYEIVDLCLRIAQAGFRIVYDPSVMVIASDAGGMWGSPGEYFQSKHAAALAERFTCDSGTEVFARHASASVRRVLFIEDTVPLRRIGSGFVRSNDVLQTVSSLGYAVTAFPVNGYDHHLAGVFADIPEQVEVMYSLSIEHLAGFLEARPGYYDTIWIARTHNLAKVRPILDRLIGTGALKARVVLDTEAITPQREALQAQLAGRQYDLQAAMRPILADAMLCQHVVAVTAAEAESLRSYGLPRVSLIGHLIESSPSGEPFSQRTGMLFVGAIHQQDSPNLDGLVWFIDQVLPLIDAELGWETKLTVAGYLAPGIDLGRLDHSQRIRLCGPVADLAPLYGSHRIFVAPTRYAAGTPYKVLEAASQGLPVVATELLRSQMGWRHQQEMIAAGVNDPAAFAAGAVGLYRDEALWSTIRGGALHRLRQENGRQNFVKAVASALAPPLAAERPPRPIQQAE